MAVYTCKTPQSAFKRRDDAPASIDFVAGDPYTPDESGIYLPAASVSHREDDYASQWLPMLREMQQRHFWYRGRHRFLYSAFTHVLRRADLRQSLRGIDLGGGCGGWVRYLARRAGNRFNELALADSSRMALTLAADQVGPGVKRYMADLLRLGWRERWNVAFLLDVLEHIPNDLDVLRQIRGSLRPGGLLFITTPALRFFWSHNDTVVRHVRRYSRGDFRRLAAESGFEVVFSRYFMFFLSPLLLASRWRHRNPDKMTALEIDEQTRRSHETPWPPINNALAAIFAAETPLGVRLPFPWGTSVLAVLRRTE